MRYRGPDGGGVSGPGEICASVLSTRPRNADRQEILFPYRREGHRRREHGRTERLPADAADTDMIGRGPPFQ
jgi:hypothetical protein